MQHGPCVQEAYQEVGRSAALLCHPLSNLGPKQQPFATAWPTPLPPGLLASVDNKIDRAAALVAVVVVLVVLLQDKNIHFFHGYWCLEDSQALVIQVGSSGRPWVAL